MSGCKCALRKRVKANLKVNVASATRPHDEPETHSHGVGPLGEDRECTLALLLILGIEG